MFSIDSLYSDFPTFAPKPVAQGDGRQFSKDPINTGSSVLGVKFNGGVVVAADTLTSYGSMARFQDCPRVFKVNKNALIGCGGDYADFQYIHELISQRVIEDECIDDGFAMKPKALHSWLTGVLYNRRSQFDPLWNVFLVAGMEDGEPFLGFVDRLGTAFEDGLISTGFGAYLATPLIRKAVAEAKPRGGLSEQEAIDLLEKCLEVLYYRDARSWPRHYIGIVDAEGVRILGPRKLKSNWEIATFVRGYEALVSKLWDYSNLHQR